MTTLFQQSCEVKSKYIAAAQNAAGYHPHGEAKAFDTGIPNLLERWVLTGSEDSSSLPIVDANQIMEIRNLVRDVSRISHAALLYLDDLLHLDLARPGHTQCSAHSIYYPARKGSVSNGARRQSIHCDTSYITLATKPLGDPLIIFSGIEESPAEIGENDILILYGSKLEAMSGARIVACKHTVSNTQVALMKSRTSFVYFVEPPASN